jgi:periplasmic protein TonB
MPPERTRWRHTDSPPRPGERRTDPLEPVPQQETSTSEPSEAAPFRPEDFPEESLAAGASPSGDGPSQAGEMPHGTAPAGAAVASGERAGAAPADILRGGSGREGTGGAGDGPALARLRDAIQARIVYPDEAVRRGLEGEVLLRIRIEKGGNPGEVRVARSSGVRILDEAARRGVVRAAPLPSAPGWFEVPVRFSLR